MSDTRPWPDSFDTLAYSKKKDESVLRTIDKYQMHLALLSTWQKAEKPDRRYIRQLKNELYKLKAQMKVKGIYLAADMDL